MIGGFAFTVPFYFILTKAIFQSKYFQSPDGGLVFLAARRPCNYNIMAGLFTVDITPPISERPLGDGEPVLIVLHGLTGGSDASYVRAVLAAVTPRREDGGLGMRGLAMNFRGCMFEIFRFIYHKQCSYVHKGAGSPVLTKKLYHVRIFLHIYVIYLQVVLIGRVYGRSTSTHIMA
jgi:hypothetical protein